MNLFKGHLVLKEMAKFNVHPHHGPDGPIIGVWLRSSMSSFARACVYDVRSNLATDVVTFTLFGWSIHICIYIYIKKFTITERFFFCQGLSH